MGAFYKLLLPPLLALLWAAPHLPAQAPDRNVRFGLPSDAKADPGNRDDYLIARPQYTLSYNAEKRMANWVSWHLSKSDVGKATRGPFEPDPLLPKGFARVTSGVYTGGGFNRGHHCPSKDRSDSEENNEPIGGRGPGRRPGDAGSTYRGLDGLTRLTGLGYQQP